MMSQFSDPQFLQEAYRTDEGLATRIDAQKRYQKSSRNIFEELTRDAMTLVQPTTILDIGAGTGAWYPWIRQYVGMDPHYHAIDQSPAMIATLTKILSTDPNGFAVPGEAGALREKAESFDWVGLHYMLYHVPDIAGALREAWTLVKPGGVLIAATNGPNSYHEMHALHQMAAEQLNLPFVEEQRGDRFSLQNGAEFFPSPPHLTEFPAGLRFPTLDRYLAYYGSGFCWAGIPEAYHHAKTHKALLDIMGELAQSIVTPTGAIELSHIAGYFWLTKS